MSNPRLGTTRILRRFIIYRKVDGARFFMVNAYVKQEFTKLPTGRCWFDIFAHKEHAACIADTRTAFDVIEARLGYIPSYLHADKISKAFDECDAELNRVNEFYARDIQAHNRYAKGCQARAENAQRSA